MKTAIAILFMLLLISVQQAYPVTHSFDFQHPTEAQTIDAYMSGISGTDIHVTRGAWINAGSLMTYKNKALVVDFDPLASGSSLYEVSHVSFDWAIPNPKQNAVFFVDVYDDTTDRWINGVFKRKVGKKFTGKRSLFLSFENHPGWEITRFRVRGTRPFEVIDNLKVTDTLVPIGDSGGVEIINYILPERDTDGDPPIRSVPEPSMILLLSTGLVSLSAFMRKYGKA